MSPPDILDIMMEKEVHKLSYVKQEIRRKTELWKRPKCGRSFARNEEWMIKLRYGATNTFLIPCHNGFLLIDTGCAGTLPAFYKAIKQNGIRVSNIVYVLATHYHPDHMGLIPDLMKLGVRLLLIDTQRDSVHFSDYIFARDGLPFEPIDETQAALIRIEESRKFLSGIGIDGEIIAAPSHSPDSISLLLDSGDAFVGDLQPYEYLDGYDGDDAAKADWTRIHSFQPKRIFYAHADSPKTPVKVDIILDILQKRHSVIKSRSRINPVVVFFQNDHDSHKSDRLAQKLTCDRREKHLYDDSHDRK